MIYYERRTIHLFKDEKVDKELVKKALSTALYAPNHFHTQPWSFVWLGTKTRKQLAERSFELKKDGSEMVKKKILEKFMTPSDLIVLLCKKSSDFQRFLEDYASVACGVQNISLFLWSQKIGTKWSTGTITQDYKLYEFIGIDPLQHQSVGFLWIGVPKKIPPCPPKISLNSVLKYVP